MHFFELKRSFVQTWSRIAHEMHISKGTIQGSTEAFRLAFFFAKIIKFKIVVESFSTKPCVGKGAKIVIQGRTNQISSM